MIEAGKFYGGVFKSFDTVGVGKNGTPAMQFTFTHDVEGELITTQFIGDGTWIRKRLIEMGCDAKLLVSGTWRQHIADTLAGKRIAGKAEEFDGRVHVKGLFADGGGGAAKLTLQGDRSPFADADDGGVF